MTDELTLRPIRLADVAAVEEIQRLNPMAAQWNGVDYLAFQTTVAELGGRVVGFQAIQSLTGGEAEILNLAVHPEFRRLGIGTRLLAQLDFPVLFLDVRASNQTALRFYHKHGFVKTGHRRKYYQRPVDDSIMMTRRRS
jgi:ribosomal-protein-alanine N-acetyltransferase